MTWLLYLILLAPTSVKGEPPHQLSGGVVVVSGTSRSVCDREAERLKAEKRASLPAGWAITHRCEPMKGGESSRGDV